MTQLNGNVKQQLHVFYKFKAAHLFIIRIHVISPFSIGNILGTTSSMKTYSVERKVNLTD